MKLLPNGVYAAEDAADLGPQIDSISELQAFVRHVVMSRYWRRVSDIREINLVLTWETVTAAWVEKGRGRIQLHSPISKLGILHEMAHIPHYNGVSTRPDHNREWMRTYVGLVDHFLGARQCRRLREEIIARKVYGYRALVD